MKYFINPKKLKKNGKSTVYAVVHLMNKTLHINTCVEVEPERFDVENGKIKGTGVKDDNLILDRVASSINEIFVKYRLQHKQLTPDLLLQEYRNPSLVVDFYGYMEKEIADRYKRKEIVEGTRKQHFSVLNKLKAFTPGLSFSQITPQFIARYTGHLRVKLKNDVNTIHKDLKCLKAYLNIAVRNGIIERNPFDVVKLKLQKTEPTHLTSEELSRLWMLYNQPGKKLKPDELKTLRHFLFMCAVGCRISDFKALSVNSLKNGKLCYTPTKTKGTSQIEIKVWLTDKAKRLIADENSRNMALFRPVAEQTMNKQLKLIAAASNIKKDISNHTARHTFATLFAEKTKDVASLQRLLGHARIEQTMKYIHISEISIDEQMQRFEKLLEM
jgi:integrase/recombinase XerD